MDKTEERPVAFYIFKSLSESLPPIYIYTHIYIQEVNISIGQEHTFHFNKNPRRNRIETTLRV